MKIVLPKAEILPRMEPLKKVELCARVSYKSENKITDDSAERFCRKLLELGHTSVFEHTRVMVPESVLPFGTFPSGPFPSGTKLPYGIESRIGYVCCATPAVRKSYDIELSRMFNGRDFIALGGTLEQLKNLAESEDYMSVRFVCDRAIANELVRHRQMSFVGESTRYVNYKDGVEFILPVPFDWTAYSEVLSDVRPTAEDPRYVDWKQACAYAERAYIQMIRHGATPQEARDVLPLSTKTELIMTGMYKQWADVLKLRLDKAAHPQMQYLMQLLVDLPEFPKDKIKWEDDRD